MSTIKLNEPIVEEKQTRWKWLSIKGIIPKECVSRNKWHDKIYKDYEGINISNYFGGKIFYLSCKYYGYFTPIYPELDNMFNTKDELQKYMIRSSIGNNYLEDVGLPFHNGKYYCKECFWNSPTYGDKPCCHVKTKK